LFHCVSTSIVTYSIDWTYHAHIATYTVNEYERRKNPIRRSEPQLVLPPKARSDILAEWQVSVSEMTVAAQAAAKIQHQRRKSAAARDSSSWMGQNLWHQWSGGWDRSTHQALHLERQHLAYIQQQEQQAALQQAAAQQQRQRSGSEVCCDASEINPLDADFDYASYYSVQTPNTVGTAATGLGPNDEDNDLDKQSLLSDSHRTSRSSVSGNRNGGGPDTTAAKYSTGVVPLEILMASASGTVGGGGGTTTEATRSARIPTVISMKTTTVAAPPSTRPLRTRSTKSKTAAAATATRPPPLRSTTTPTPTSRHNPGRHSSQHDRHSNHSSHSRTPLSKPVSPNGNVAAAPTRAAATATPKTARPSNQAPTTSEVHFVPDAYLAQTRTSHQKKQLSVHEEARTKARRLLKTAARATAAVAVDDPTQTETSSTTSA
jgi:hypothetical protein